MIARKATLSVHQPVPNNASTDTFGNVGSSRRPPSPAPGRHLEEPRPNLQRSNTARDPKAQEAAKFIFTTGVFSDPPVSKGWRFGPQVISEGHRRLVALLREESSRLYLNNNDLRQRLTLTQRDARELKSTVDQLKAQLRMEQGIRDTLSEDLAVAHASLAEMDAMVDNARSKRLSRRLHLTEEQAEDLRHAN